VKLAILVASAIAIFGGGAAFAQDDRLEHLPEGKRYVLASPFHVTCRQYLGFADGFRAEGQAGEMKFNDKFVWLTTIDYWVSGFVTSAIADKLNLAAIFKPQDPELSFGVHEAYILGRVGALCGQTSNSDKTIADIAKMVVEEVRRELK
jgi:hypothetical protein